MAVIRAGGKTISDAAQVAAYLHENGIEYSSWGTARVPKGVTARSMSAEQKQQILDLYRPEIDALIAKNGYLTADVVALSPDTPNLDGILAAFDKKHFHTDDEVRFVAAGRGIFHIKHRNADTFFDCEVLAGDLIVVPARAWHFFTLCEERQIAAVRVFKTKDGWAANYESAA